MEQIKKISLKDVKEQLSRKEMRTIAGGYDTGYGSTSDRICRKNIGTSSDFYGYNYEQYYIVCWNISSQSYTYYDVLGKEMTCKP